MAVETALFGIAKSVLGALSSPALNEFRLLWDQKKQLERLQETVAAITNVLHDADRKQAGDAAVQGWLARLRDALYEADDLFDTISFNVWREKAKTGSKTWKEVRHFISKPYHFAFLVKTAHKVKGIRERLDAIASDIKGFGFLPVHTEQDRRFQRRQTHSYVPSNEVVGREQEREDIVRMLLPECFQEQKGVSVIAVIGIGGLGKTALSQLVYNDERVQRGFDLCIWACINYFSCLQDVLVALLKAVTKGEVQKLDLDTLQSLFREKIQGKRFLLVLDDVWDEDPLNWNELKKLLDSGKPGSMVLTTARSVKVAQSLSAVEPYYYLQHLSDESALLLFKKKVLGEKRLHLSSILEGLAQQIVKKCANVPLAIVAIASFLKYEEERKWHSLVDGEFPIFVIGNNDTNIMEVLKFSYKQFPYPVKRCFAFCSLYFKDYTFEKDELIRLWIAEGLVEPYDVGQNLEDRAEEYFFYLVDRCFFQSMGIDTEEYVTQYTCKMHDLVHDLAKEVAGSESILVDQNNAHKPWDKTVRHVSLVDQTICSFSYSKSLRTILEFDSGYVETNKLNKLMLDFKALRVLDLSWLGVTEIPASIGKLIHLRLLDLSRNFYMEKLPSSICSLHHLQSLILQSCVRLKELPEEIGKLLSLRHLMLDGCEGLSQMPPGLAALTSLVTLDRPVTHKPGGELRYLECLDNLSGSLKILISETSWKNVTIDAQRSCLSRKSRIKAFNVQFVEVETRREVDTLMDALEPHPNLEYLKVNQFGGSRMPLWITYLDRLVVLRVRKCEGLVDLPPLSRLQSLKVLDIREMNSMLSIEGSCMLDGPELMFFPSLETLYIKDIPDLRGWWEKAPAVLPTFPRVTSVVIKNCPKLIAECMPLFPLVVQHLELSQVQEEVVWRGIGSELASSIGINTSSALKTLSISCIEGLRSMGEAQIRHLSSLQSLHMNFGYQLKTVSCRGIAYLTSLEQLNIDCCGGLKWVDGDDDEKPEFPWGNLSRLRELSIPNVTRSCFKGLKHLTSLETLNINNFDEELQSMSSTNKEEEEEEDGMPWKPLQKLGSLELGFGETSSMRYSDQQHLKGVEYLTSLRKLTLRSCNTLPWRVLLCLYHLEVLWISGVKKVIIVDDSTQIQLSNTALRKLKIEDCLAEWVIDIPWKSFPFLQSLILYHIRNMEALPEGIQHLASLQHLEIRSYIRVVSLPTWISSLSSLHYLCLRWSSEELKKRCERLTGEDWPLIQHIQSVYI